MEEVIFAKSRLSAQNDDFSRVRNENQFAIFPKRFFNRDRDRKKKFHKRDPVARMFFALEKSAGTDPAHTRIMKTGK